MSIWIRNTAVAATGLALLASSALPAAADGFRHGHRDRRHVEVTKKIVFVHKDNRRDHRRWAKRRAPVRYVAQRPIHVSPRHAGPAYYGNGDRTLAGGLIGAVIGGLTGSTIGKGSGRTAAIIGGTVIGAVIGGNIAQAMDRTDHLQTAQVLETAQTGSTVGWVNPDTGYNYAVTPTATYQTRAGQYCREYTTVGQVGGRQQELYGTACRMPDGSWKIQS